MKQRQHFNTCFFVLPYEYRWYVYGSTLGVLSNTNSLDSSLSQKGNSCSTKTRNISSRQGTRLRIQRFLTYVISLPLGVGNLSTLSIRLIFIKGDIQSCIEKLLRVKLRFSIEWKSMPSYRPGLDCFLKFTNFLF